MEATTYNITDLQNRKMFYMLDNIMDDSVQLFRRTPAGDEEFTQYSLHYMPDGKLLIAFYDYWSMHAVHSLVAKCGDTEELVNTQPFERIIPYWNPGLDYKDRGGFFFLNSKPIYTDVNDWRCDNTFYGPERYIAPGASPLFGEFKADDIIVYEPIINMNGTATLCFVHFKNDEHMRDYVVNADVIPSCGVTLSEMFRLLIEWATLADEPFNSTEPIVLDAKEFLNQIEFDGSLVADQTNMQVAQFFLGNTDARRRPADVVDTNQRLLDFVKQKMAHMSLASLLSCYPEYTNLSAEIQFDIESADKQFVDYLGGLQIEGDFTLGNWEDALDFLPERLVHASNLFVLRWGCLKRQKDLAISLQTP
jgi:hypothetical protein